MKCFLDSEKREGEKEKRKYHLIFLGAGTGSLGKDYPYDE